MLLRSGVDVGDTDGNPDRSNGIDSGRRMSMEAFLTAFTQLCWWALLILSATGLFIMLGVLFWTICNEIDKEKLAKTKKPDDQCKWPTGDEG